MCNVHIFDVHTEFRLAWAYSDWRTEEKTVPTNGESPRFPTKNSMISNAFKFQRKTWLHNFQIRLCWRKMMELPNFFAICCILVLNYLGLAWKYESRNQYCLSSEAVWVYVDYKPTLTHMHIWAIAQNQTHTNTQNMSMRTDRQKYMQQKGIVHRASSSDTNAIHIPTAQNGHSIDELHL